MKICFGTTNSVLNNKQQTLPVSYNDKTYNLQVTTSSSSFENGNCGYGYIESVSAIRLFNKSYYSDNTRTVFYFCIGY